MSAGPMCRELTVHAPAKINLALAVDAPTPGEPDQRHPICSWMVPVTLCDDVTLTALPRRSISRYAILWAEDARHQPDIDWPIRKDLAVRAHLLLESTLRRELPVQIRIDKRIPLGAGLGGGSSDAGAALAGLNTLFDLNLSTTQLAELAAQIGSDVPFFVRPRPALVHEFGQTLVTVDAPSELDLVLILPQCRCNTGEVYGRFDSVTTDDTRRGIARGRTEIETLVARGKIGDGGGLFNDLTRPAMDQQPELESLSRSVTDAAQRPVHLTGSGAAMFVVCSNGLEAEQLVPAIEESIGVPALAVALDRSTASC